MIQVDQGEWQQQTDQGKASPWQPLGWQVASSVEPYQQGGAPEQTAQGLNGRITPADRALAIPASPPKQQPTEDRNVVVPADGMATAGAMAAGMDHRLTSRQTPDHDVGEAADAGAQCRRPEDDQPRHPITLRFRAWRPCLVRPRIRSRPRKSSSGSRTGASNTTRPSFWSYCDHNADRVHASRCVR